MRFPNSEDIASLCRSSPSGGDEEQRGEKAKPIYLGYSLKKGQWPPQQAINSEERENNQSLARFTCNPATQQTEAERLLGIRG